MGVYSSTAANAYADKIKAIYEHLGEIRKVAGRLTPVEDLTAFQNQIEALYSYLDLLVEASNIIVTATPTGEAILTGTVASIRELLGIGLMPDDYVTHAELEAAIAALRDYLLGQIALTGDHLTTIDITLDQLETYKVYQQSEIDGLQISYFNVAAGLETNQTNIESALSRLTIREEYATLQDQRLDEINESLVSTTLGLQATNDIVAGHTASIETTANAVTLHTASIDQLSSTLTDLDTEVTANSSALSLMETAISNLGDDIVAQSSLTNALKSVIGGSGNLLPNADFAADANGWEIVVAEDDWADTVLTTNLFGMPEDVNCLEVLGNPAPDGQIVVESPPILVSPSSYYILSGYPCVDNGTVQLSYKAYDNAGTVVDQGVCPPTFNHTTSTNFNDYTRSWVKFLTTADTVKLRLYLTVTGDGDFVVQGALFRPMVEKAWADQVGPSEWTPNVSGVPEALAEAVQTLTTETSLINGQLSAMATAATELEARVGNAEAALINEMITSANKDASLVSSINTLTTQLTDLDTLATGTADAVDSLTTRIDTAEDSITANSSQLTTLQAQVDSMDADTGGYAGAISALDARVSITEDAVDSMASDITALQSSASFGNRVYTQTSAPPTTGTNGDLWFDTDDGNKPYVLTSGVWVARQDLSKNSIFVQATAPTAKALNDLWIETDNNNTMWRWDGSNWVPAADPRIASNASAITDLTTRTSAAEDRLDAQATLNTTLSSSIGAKNSIFVQGTAPSSTGRVTGDTWIDTSTGNTIKTWNGTTWVARPDNNRNKVFVQPGTPTAGAVGDLWYDSDDGYKPRSWNGTSWVDVTDARTTANADATSLLTTRVEDAENALLAQATSITNLTATLDTVGGDNLLLNSSFENGSANWTPFNSGTTGFVTSFVSTLLPVGQTALRMSGTAVAVGNYLDLRVPAGNRPKVIAGKKYTLSSYMRGTATGQAAIYIQWLNSVGTVLSTSALTNQSINSTTYNRYVLTAVAPASAVSAVVFAGRLVSTTTGSLFLEVDNVQFQEGDVATGYKLSGVETANAVETLDTRVTIGEDGIATLNASWSVKLDVNGYISGITSVNDGDTASFIVACDTFQVTKPGGGAGLYWQNNLLWNKGTARSMLSGQGFGTTNDLLFYIGPTPASAAAADKNLSNFYIDTSGNARFSGILYQSALELGSTRIHTGGGRLAPFTLRDFGYKAQPSGTRNFSGEVQLLGFVSPDSGTGYHYKRFSRKRADVVLDARLDGNGSGNENIYIEVRYNGGAWVNVASYTGINVDYRGGFTLKIRYTTLDTWDTVEFRAYTDNNNTICLSFSMTVDNTYETANTGGSSSGFTATSGGGGTAPPIGGHSGMYGESLD